jgi:hypothetical protein
MEEAHPARGRGGRSSDVAETDVVPAPCSGQTDSQLRRALIDCEEDRILRAVVFELLAETERK